jgi:hypothetical protein
MALYGVKRKPSFTKISSSVQNLLRGNEKTHTEKNVVIRLILHFLNTLMWKGYTY